MSGCCGGCSGGCNCTPGLGGQVAVSSNDCPEFLDVKLVGGGLVTTTVLNPGACGEQIEICVPNLISTDGSITIVADIPGKTLDLSGCCPANVDELVAVDPTCPAGYLEDLIVPEPASAIRITKVGCTLEIGVDTNLVPDVQVAVDSTCPGEYLEDVMTGANGILVNKVAGGVCNVMQTSVDPNWVGWQSPLARISIEDTYDTFSALGAVTDHPILQFAEVNETTGSGMVGTVDRLTAPIAGWYYLSFNGRAEVLNDGVSSMRIYNTSTNAANAFRIDEGWAGTRNGPDVTAGPPRFPYYGVQGSLSNFSFGQTIPIFMAAGEQIGMMLRVSCQVDPAFKSAGTPDGRVRLRGHNGTPGSPVPGGGGGISMTLTRHSNVNGQRLFF